MKKIKITSEQYRTILVREHETRLSDSSVVVNESLVQGPELLEEGLKEVLLGVAMLMGVNLSGQNKELASGVLKNNKAMSEIKKTLEDENKLKDLVKSFGEKGMNNPELKLAKNAKKIIDAFNEKTTTKSISDDIVINLINLDKTLAKEYEEKQKELAEKTNEEPSIKTDIKVKDIIEIELDNDKLFEDDKINQEGVVFIESIIDGITKQNSNIISVHIESSTDSNTSLNLVSDDDKTGNIALAYLRTELISDIFNKSNDDIHITHREIPNNGSDVVSNKEFLNSKENLDVLKSKTSDFRYLKIRMVIEFEQKEQDENIKPEEMVKNYRFEITKHIKSNDKSDFIKSDNKLQFINNKIKCQSKINPNVITQKCTTFEG